MADGDGNGDGDETRAEAVPNEIPNECKNGYRIGPEGDGRWPPSVPNGITKNSRGNYQEIFTEISQRPISLSRGLHMDIE